MTIRTKRVVVQALRKRQILPALGHKSLTFGKYNPTPDHPTSIHDAFAVSTAIPHAKKAAIAHMATVGYDWGISGSLLRTHTYSTTKKLLTSEFPVVSHKAAYGTDTAAYLQAAHALRDIHTSLNAPLAPLGDYQYPPKKRKVYQYIAEEILCPICETPISIPAVVEYKPPYDAASFVATGTHTCACGNTEITTEGSMSAPSPVLKISQRTPTTLSFRRKNYITLYNIPYYFRTTYHTYRPTAPSIILSTAKKATKKLNREPRDTDSFLNHLDISHISDHPARLALVATPAIPPYYSSDPIPSPHLLQAPKSLAIPVDPICHAAATYFTNLAHAYNIAVLTSRHLITPFGFALPLTPDAAHRYPQALQPFFQLLKKPSRTLQHSETLSAYHRTLSPLQVFRQSRSDQYIAFKNAYISALITSLSTLSPFLTTGEARRFAHPLSTYHPLAVRNLPLYDASFSISNKSHLQTLGSNLHDLQYRNAYLFPSSLATSHVFHANPKNFAKSHLTSFAMYATILRYHTRYILAHLPSPDANLKNLYHLSSLLSTLYPQSTKIADIFQSLQAPIIHSNRLSAFLQSLHAPHSPTHIHLASSFMPR